jgi:predicted RNA-binding Zn ribbon-like protein
MSGPQSSYALQPPKLIGNSLCVDFINTVAWRGRRAGSEERLTGYADLVHWSAGAGALRRGETSRLLAEARRRPEAAAGVLASGVALREALARLLAGSRSRRSHDLALLNGWLSRAAARSAVVASVGGYRWLEEPEGEPLERPLWPILWDAAALLTSNRRVWVHTCEDRECAWMFLDLSRTRTRRWCSMDDCGNRAKARRHYARKLAAAGKRV